jgi:hypothetical protein
MSRDVKPYIWEWGRTSKIHSWECGKIPSLLSSYLRLKRVAKLPNWEWGEMSASYLTMRRDVKLPIWEWGEMLSLLFENDERFQASYVRMRRDVKPPIWQWGEILSFLSENEERC